MSTDHIRYDLLVQDALRSVVKNVLADAAKNGMPGEHHFYVSFKTTAPGVRISNRLREQYPDEMTIVLQHQYWDLGITEHTFEVGLSFGGVPERLLVPFDAVVGFFDPSVQFGLKFEVQDADAVAENDDMAGVKLAKPSLVANPAKQIGTPVADGGTLRKPNKNDGQSDGKKETSAITKRTKKIADKTEADDPTPSAAVVSLDAFRKKK
jgi:uncharacterized protein